MNEKNRDDKESDSQCVQSHIQRTNVRVYDDVARQANKDTESNEDQVEVILDRYNM